jgi:hydrogenase-1 operon protein HyaE
MTRSPLIQALIDRHAVPVIGERDVPEFCAAHEWVVLFFAGDAARIMESNDVAVVLPELIARFSPRLTPALVDSASEMQLQATYQFMALPALVFLKHGRYVGMIPRIQSWDRYVRETDALLQKEPTEPPPFVLPNACGRTGDMV